MRLPPSTSTAPGPLRLGRLLGLQLRQGHQGHQADHNSVRLLSLGHCTHFPHS